MKKLLLIVSLFFMSFSLFAQDQQAEMKAWQEYMTPGEMHKMLANSVGNWKAEIKMWMDPNSEPTITNGTSTTEAIMDGRFFQTKHTSNMMNMPMEGFEIRGFDNGTKKFFTIWIDNFGTGYIHLEGTMDAANNQLVYTGSGTDHRGQPYTMRQLVKIIDNDNIFIEFFMNQNDKEFKSMEMKYTRQ